MAAKAPRGAPPVAPDTPIVVKVVYDGLTRRFKMPLRDMNATIFPVKVGLIAASSRHELASYGSPR